MRERKKKKFIIGIWTGISVSFACIASYQLYVIIENQNQNNSNQSERESGECSFSGASIEEHVENEELNIKTFVGVGTIFVRFSENSTSEIVFVSAEESDKEYSNHASFVEEFVSKYDNTMILYCNVEPADTQNYEICHCKNDSVDCNCDSNDVFITDGILILGFFLTCLLLSVYGIYKNVSD